MEDLFGLPRSAGPANSEDYKLAYSVHDLERLLSTIASNLAALDLPEIPAVFSKVLALLNAVEEGRPDRLRYASFYDRRSGRIKASFDDGVFETDAKYAPIDEVGALLDQILEGQVAAPGTVDGPLGAIRMFFDAIIDGEECAHDRVADELERLDAATRSGDLVWRITAEPGLSVEGHPLLAEIKTNIGSRYLLAGYRSRQLALVNVKATAVASDGDGAHPADALFLASLRPDGTLTEGVFPLFYRSSLEGAVRASAHPQEI